MYLSIVYVKFFANYVFYQVVLDIAC